MWLLAERERNGGDSEAGRLQNCTAAEDDVGMSDGSYTLDTCDSASESGGAAADGPHAGGACCLSQAVFLVSGAAKPRLIMYFNAAVHV
jgi:hypothetical protein